MKHSNNTSPRQEAVEALTATIKKEWLSPKEVNQEFGFSVSTLAKWRMDNLNLSYSKVSKYIKYKRSDILNFLDAHTIATIGA